MNAMRVLAERDVMPKVGASFSRGEDGGVLFSFTVDPSTIVGPRPARNADKVAHPEAWAAFVATDPAPPLVEESPSAGAAQDIRVPVEFDQPMLPAQDAYPHLTAAQETALDRDGDGKPGGSRKGPRGRRA